MRIRADAAREAAPFAEHFYHWGNDVAFTARLKRLGWSLECVPAARVWRDGLALRSPDKRRSAQLRLKGLVDFCLRRFGPPGEQSTRKA
jgi:GT2 family glycosyltransferase